MAGERQTVKRIDVVSLTEVPKIELAELRERAALKEGVSALVSEVQRFSDRDEVREKARDLGETMKERIDEAATQKGDVQEATGRVLQKNLEELIQIVTAVRIGHIHDLHSEKFEIDQKLADRRTWSITGDDIEKLKARRKEISAEVKRFEPSEEEQKDIDAKNAAFQKRVKKEMAEFEPHLKALQAKESEIAKIREQAEDLISKQLKERDPLVDQRKELRKELESGNVEAKRKAELDKQIALLDKEILELNEKYERELNALLTKITVAEKELEGLKLNLGEATTKLTEKMSKISVEVFDNVILPDDEKCVVDLQALQVVADRSRVIDQRVAGAVRDLQVTRISVAKAVQEEDEKEDKTREEEKKGRDEVIARDDESKSLAES